MDNDMAAVFGVVWVSASSVKTGHERIKLSDLQAAQSKERGMKRLATVAQCVCSCGKNAISHLIGSDRTKHSVKTGPVRQCQCAKPNGMIHDLAAARVSSIYSIQPKVC